MKKFLLLLAVFAFTASILSSATYNTTASICFDEGVPGTLTYNVTDGSILKYSIKSYTGTNLQQDVSIIKSGNSITAKYNGYMPTYGTIDVQIDTSTGNTITLQVLVCP